MSSDEQILGRGAVDDLQVILSMSNGDIDEVVHAVEDNAPAIFTWDYEKGRRPALNKLYEKAKHSQWNGETDLDWSIEVDQEEFAKMMMELDKAVRAEHGITFEGTPFAKWGVKEWLAASIEGQNWALSQFMHGEQGALICTAKIVETVPWIDAKDY